jgi:hypothetical protein
LAGAAIAVSIGLVILVLIIWNTNSTNIIKDKPFAFEPHTLFHKSLSNYFVPDITNEINNDTVFIKTVNVGSYTSASAQLPLKVVSGRAVTFILDIKNSYPSVNSLGITITGEKGQYLLFLPYSHDDNNQGKVLFHYVFPTAGTYNIDIAFGAPEGVNFNIPVAPNGI